MRYKDDKIGKLRRLSELQGEEFVFVSSHERDIYNEEHQSDHNHYLIELNGIGEPVSLWGGETCYNLDIYELVSVDL